MQSTTNRWSYSDGGDRFFRVSPQWVTVIIVLTSRFLRPQYNLSHPFSVLSFTFPLYRTIYATGSKAHSRSMAYCVVRVDGQKTLLTYLSLYALSKVAQTSVCKPMSVDACMRSTIASSCGQAIECYFIDKNDIISCIKGANTHRKKCTDWHENHAQSNRCITGKCMGSAFLYLTMHSCTCAACQNVSATGKCYITASAISPRPKWVIGSL